MGCCECNRDKTITPEELILNCENKLSLKELRVSELARVIQCHSNEGKMTLKELSEFLSHFGLRAFDEQKESEKNLYRKFQQQSFLNPEKFTTFAILIGKGSLTSKAKELAENYEIIESEKLGIKEVKQLIDDTLEISCKLIPEFVIEDNPEIENPEYLRDYIEILESRFNAAYSLLFEVILGEEEAISSKDFVSKVSENKYAKNFESSTKIRKLVYMSKEGN